MRGIVITAIVVALAATLLYGGVLLWRAPRAERRLLALCYLLELPMSAAMFYLVRTPLDHWLHPIVGDNAIYWWGRVLYAPLTEEPAKLWPLLIPWIARGVTRDNATRVAMALGLGFGVGEVGFIADLISAEPQYAALAWYEFGGFIQERFLVCLIHGLFTSMALLGWKRWRIGFAGGVALAMLLHLLGNLPILLAAAGLFGADPALRALVLSLWVVAFWLAAMILLLVIDPRIGGIPMPGRPVVCPKCGHSHQRPFLALNLGWKRYERCPHCGKWSIC